MQWWGKVGPKAPSKVWGTTVSSVTFLRRVCHPWWELPYSYQGLPLSIFTHTTVLGNCGSFTLPYELNQVYIDLMTLAVYETWWRPSCPLILECRSPGADFMSWRRHPFNSSGNGDFLNSHRSGMAGADQEVAHSMGAWLVLLLAPLLPWPLIVLSMQIYSSKHLGCNVYFTGNECESVSACPRDKQPWSWS